KDPRKTYGIHIDIYVKKSLEYRGSLWFPITNNILPIHRFDLLINIPPSDFKSKKCSQNQCVHGKCLRYFNTQREKTFCQCYSGWSGQHCDILSTPHLECSSDSKYIGVDAQNHPICVCSLHKFGRRCFLRDTQCVNETCNDHGECVPSDLNRRFSQSSMCVCSKEFSGDHCERENNRLDLSFERNIQFLHTIFIHLIKAEKTQISNRVITFKTISSMKDTTIIYWSVSVNLILIEDLKKNYYLIDSQTSPYEKVQIIKQVKSSDRCPFINELLPQTVVQSHFLQRVKSYHSPCQKSLGKLRCFYDSIYLCLCYEHNDQHLTNCLPFNQTIEENCPDENECSDHGQCFQLGLGCSKKITCLCKSCFHGRRCQFSTQGFSLSLDNILGYHIQPSIRLIKQSTIIQISISLNIIFTFIGLTNGIFTFITFKNKSLREVGCGLYLLVSSITVLIITMLFALKFWILIFAQISQISNRLFLRSQCISLDFLLRTFLHLDQWLNACVACERAITVVQGPRFTKKKSRETAKFVINLLLIFNILTFIHEPIHRHLVDEIDEDENEKRIWCTVTYSSKLQIYNTCIHTFQFFAPFTINFISALILIAQKSRRQLNIQMKRNFQEVLLENYQEYRHLFIAPTCLVILALPRLIISYISKCMESINGSWLFLSGYFISFIPAMLTFVIFVLPSKFYKKAFHKSMIQCRKKIQRRLHM
ncbi:unnamed protein product, partial [Adineta ricciae]